jgi:RNA polymerase sigma factor (sigma-70 family)
MEYLEILELIAARDMKALELLYEKYGQQFYSYAINKWQMDTELAWDVVYKTLDTLLLKLSDYEIESQKHFDNLIFKIFINFLRQAFRAHRKKQFDIEYVDFNDKEAENTEDADDEDYLPLTQSSLPINTNIFNRAYETEVSENPLLTALKRALSEMDETERQILLLRAQNYSYDEIAKMLQIENKNLKVKYLRGKDKLRKLFENYQTDGHAQEKKQY